MRLPESLSGFIKSKAPWIIQDPRISNSELEPAQLTTDEYERLGNKRFVEEERLGSIAVAGVIPEQRQS